MASRTLLSQLSRRGGGGAACRLPSSIPSSPATQHVPRSHSLLRPNHPPLAARDLSTSPATRTIAVEPPEYLSEGERKVFALLQDGLQPSQLAVQDISGGCGSMYGIEVVSERFAGLSVIKQHRLVNSVLGDEIKKWHGVQLKTKAP